VAAYWQARGLYLRRWNRASEQRRTAQQAMDSYTRAIQLSPGDPDMWLDRGLMWLDVGNPDRALADIQQAGSLLGDYTRYYGSLSVYALAEGDQEAAAAWQERALAAQREWDAWAWRR
jgi:tetratricopeptide (TPR) repeat protein